MTVHFIGAGPGAPDLLTLRAADLIAAAPVVLYAGSLVPAAVVARARPGAEVCDTSGMTLEAIVDRMAAAHRAGEDVARVHTGDPSLFGAIAEQMRRLDALGIPYDVVPGVSSFTAAAAALKRELTVPGVSQTVIIARAPGRTPVPEGQRLEELARHGATLALFLSAGLVDEAVAALLPSYGPECPAAVVHRASWPDERVFRGTLAGVAAELRAAGVDGTAMILVGPALAAEGFPGSRLYAPEFGHGRREGRAPGPTGAAPSGVPPEAARSARPRRGFVHLVGAGPGDPALLTVRALDLLRTADVVAYDELVPRALLRHAGAGAELVGVGRRHHGSSRHRLRLHPAVLERAAEGKVVVRLKSGDPFVFGRGGEEAEELTEAGIPWDVVPGVSAAMGAAASARIPLTHREISSDVAFATGHDLVCSRPSRTEWARLAGAGTLVLYMASRALGPNLARLVALGRPASTPAAWIANATRPDEQVITGTLGDLAARVDGAPGDGPALLVIGEVVALRARLASHGRGGP